MAELYIKTEDGKELPLWIDGVYTVETEDSLVYLEVLRQQIEKEDLDRIKPFRIPKVCERCNYRKGQTCLVPTCMKVAYVPRDYGVFKSEVS